MRKKNREILENICIESVAAEGNAVAHVNGKALFVPMAVPGDIVDILVTRNKRSFMQGAVLRLVSPSPMRQKPFCSHFGDCGGCRWQLIPYDKQLEFKQQQVIDQLTRIGKLTLPPVHSIIGSEKTVQYRNKLEFTFSNSRWVPNAVTTAPLPPPVPALGFHVRGRFDKVLDIETCHLQAEPSNAIRLATRDYAIEKGLSFFDLRLQTGFLRTLMIRTTLSGEVMVVVVFAHNNPAAGEDDTARRALLDFLLQQFPQITSLYYVNNTKLNDSLSDQEAIHYAGKPYIVETMEDLKFRIGPKSFYQTNNLQALQLYRKVLEYADLKGDETVYDLYTGTGTIALFLARYCHSVTGVECVQEAIEDARENASANNMHNARFFAGDIKDVLTADFVDSQGHPHVVVLDPPRVGVHEDVLKVLLEIAPQKIIYVSCNPATQARDLALLQQQYRVTHVQPVDMFPHTHHIENIVVAEKILPAS